MKQNFRKVIANLFRTGLLAISFGALAISYLWIYEKSFVDDFEHYLVESYEAYYQEKFNECMALLNEDRPKGVKAFEAFLETLKGIEKQDRLDPLKRKVFLTIAGILRDQGDYGGTLRLAERWVSFDERDLLAQFLLATTMLEIPSMSEEGLTKLEALHTKIPEDKVVTDSYVDILFKKERYADAFGVIEKYTESSKLTLTNKNWQIFWSTGEPFNASQAFSVVPNFKIDNSCDITFQLPPKARRIRIDPPAFTPLTMANLRATRTIPAVNHQLELARFPLSVHQMGQDGVLIQSFNGDDPFFIWDIPELLTINTETTWLLEGLIQVTQPTMYKNLFRPNIAKLVKSTLLEKGDKEAFNRFTLLLSRQSGQL